MKYLGRLSTSDPFYTYLRNDIVPLLGVGVNSPDFRVYQLPASHHVCLYEDRHSHTRIIGKFFGGVAGFGPEAAFHRMEREFNNLNYLRSIGFNGYPHYVARPLGRNADLNKVLVEEFCYGTSLADFIVKAIRENARDILFQKLAALAYFLATLHNRTAQDSKVDFNKDGVYFDRIMEQLTNAQRVGRAEALEFYSSISSCREPGINGWQSRLLDTFYGSMPVTSLTGTPLSALSRGVSLFIRGSPSCALPVMHGSIKNIAGDYWMKPEKR